MSHFASTALSAPGKVLLTGGYLVLDRNYTGTVFALNARIHVVVQQLRRTHHRRPPSSSGSAEASQQPAEQSRAGSAAEETDNANSIVVRSPQFVGAVWEYGIQRCDNGGGVKVIQKGDGYVLSSHGH